MISHHRALAYRSNRDHLRGLQGLLRCGLPLTSRAAAWLPRLQPLRKRMQALGTLWDLRWHGENRVLATQSTDPQISYLPASRKQGREAV